MNAFPILPTPTPAVNAATPRPAAAVVEVRHYDPTQQAALEALAGLLFPDARIVPVACRACSGRGFVGGTDPDGVEVTDVCPICAGGAATTAPAAEVAA